MAKNTLLWICLFLSGLFTSCSEKDAEDMKDGENTKEICFSLNMEQGIVISPVRASTSLGGMQWKLFCFDDQYVYLFEETGMVGSVTDNIRVSVPKGKVYRFLFLFATTADALPALQPGESYWDLAAYAPQLPLTDPMKLLASKGEKDGTIRVAASTSSVPVTLVPRAVKVVVQKETADALEINAVTFTNAPVAVPYVHIEPQDYSDYENLPKYQRSDYQFTLQEGGVCYMLPDLCAGSFGTKATLQVSGTQDIPVTVPAGLVLNAGAGKIYYIKVATDADGKPIATWATRTVEKTLRLATQNLWGKNASTVVDYFNQINVDVLCGQECGGFSDAEIQARGLYAHSHNNNGQVKCTIISRYPFAGTTPNRYGVYIDLGENITALVMNCHGAYKPYGPYQLSGIEYEGYPATSDVDYVVKMNKEVRQGMVDRLLEDFTSATTPFISISGDFNEPSWLDWTEGTQSAGMTPYVIEWPTTRALWEGGVKGDAYRTNHPDPVINPGYTWTPFPGAQEVYDRLDMTLYKVSPNTTVKDCQIIGENENTSDFVLPSWIFDHRGLRTEFIYKR